METFRNMSQLEPLLFEIGSYEWALSKALQGFALTHLYLERDGKYAMFWDKQSSFYVNGCYDDEKENYDSFSDCLEIFISYDHNKTHKTDKSWRVVTPFIEEDSNGDGVS